VPVFDHQKEEKSSFTPFTLLLFSSLRVGYCGFSFFHVFSWPFSPCAFTLSFLFILVVFWLVCGCVIVHRFGLLLCL
jgi:hypothetical protein